MPESAQKLGNHLRRLRQANSKSQSEVAKELQVSRSAVAQMELGNRSVKAHELDGLATLYGCSVTSLLAVPEQPAERGDDELVADLIQSIPEMAEDTTAPGELREAVAVSRALTELESKLGLEIYSAGPPSYGFNPPSTAWEGVHQGYVAAEEERRRMDLGYAPIRDVDDTLAINRIRATKIRLPEKIASLYLHTPETGILVVVNQLLPVERRRFRYAHGYAHALFDGDHRWLVCRPHDQHTFPEVRASAFAGRFLIPEAGLQRYLQSLGKDTLGRRGGAVLKLFSEHTDSSGAERRVRVDGRGRRGATPISACDLTQIACYFGASRSLAAHTLRNLRYITEQELEALERRDAEGTAARAQEALALRNAEVESERDAFRSRLLTLAVEGLSRGAIDLERFDEVTSLVGLTGSERQALLDSMEPDGAARESRNETGTSHEVGQEGN